MSTNKLKFVVAAMIASAGFAALACGGASEEGSESNVPVASDSASSTAPKTTAHVVAPKPTATAAATVVVAPPPESTLPASFNSANDARKAADAALATLLATKETNCDVIAAALAKFTADNSAAYSVWNAEYAKLTPDQMKLATSRAMGGPDLAASLGVGGFKACLDKKDPKLGTAMRAFLAVATSGPPHK